MTAKVEEVISKIVTHPDAIEDIYHSGKELYFRYKKYFFSVAQIERARGNTEYMFYVYPKWKLNAKTLSNACDEDPDNVSMIAYDKDELSEVAIEKLAMLYSLLEEKNLGIGDVFDDILRD